MFQEVRPVENTNYDRRVRENQKTEFKKILEEDQISSQIAEQLATSLEQEAYTLSGGDHTRDYRTRVNTVKMRLKGTKGQLIRTALVEQIMTPKELMSLDMSKLSEDSVQAFLQKEQRDLPHPQTNIKKNVPQRGPPTRPPGAGIPPIKNQVVAPPIPQSTTQNSQQIVNQQQISEQIKFDNQNIQTQAEPQLFNQEQELNLQTQPKEQNPQIQKQVPKQQIPPPNKSKQVTPAQLTNNQTEEFGIQQQEIQQQNKNLNIQINNQLSSNIITKQQNTETLKNDHPQLVQQQLTNQISSQQFENEKNEEEEEDQSNFDSLKQNQEKLNQLAEQLRSEESEEEQQDSQNSNIEYQENDNPKENYNFSQNDNQEEKPVLQFQNAINDQNNQDSSENIHHTEPEKQINNNEFDQNQNDNFQQETIKQQIHYSQEQKDQQSNEQQISSQIHYIENQLEVPHQQLKEEEIQIHQNNQDQSIKHQNFIPQQNQHQQHQQQQPQQIISTQKDTLNEQIVKQQEELIESLNLNTQTPKFTIQLQQLQTQQIDVSVFEQMIKQRDMYYEKQITQLINQNKDLQHSISQFQQDHSKTIYDIQQKNVNYQTQIQQLQNENQLLRTSLQNQEQNQLKQLNQLKEQIQSERKQFQKLQEIQQMEKQNERHFIDKLHSNTQQRKDIIHKYRIQQTQSNLDDQITILQGLLSKLQPPQLPRVQQFQQPIQIQPNPQQQIVQTVVVEAPSTHQHQVQQQSQQYWANEDEVNLQGQIVNADSGSTQLKTGNNQIQVQDVQDAQDEQGAQDEQQQFEQQDQEDQEDQQDEEEEDQQFDKINNQQEYDMQEQQQAIENQPHLKQQYHYEQQQEQQQQQQQQQQQYKHTQQQQQLLSQQSQQSSQSQQSQQQLSLQNQSQQHQEETIQNNELQHKIDKKISNEKQQNEQLNIDQQQENSNSIKNEIQENTYHPPPPRKQNHQKQENQATFAHPRLAHKQENNHNQQQNSQQNIQANNPFFDYQGAEEYFETSNQTNFQQFFEKQVEIPKQTTQQQRAKQTNRRANVPGSLFD